MLSTMELGELSTNHLGATITRPITFRSTHQIHATHLLSMKQPMHSSGAMSLATLATKNAIRCSSGVIGTPFISGIDCRKHDDNPEFYPYDYKKISCCFCLMIYSSTTTPIIMIVMRFIEPSSIYDIIDKTTEKYIFIILNE